MKNRLDLIFRGKKSCGKWWLFFVDSLWINYHPPFSTRGPHGFREKSFKRINKSLNLLAEIPILLDHLFDLIN
jgi:hypothetical protein